MIPGFSAKVVPEPNSGCWLWIGAITGAGYGNIAIRRKATAAHRVVYEAIRGPIPEGLDLDHRCRVRSCVNPDHLEPVTPAVNAQRGEWGMRTHCPRGHAYDAANTRYVLNLHGNKSRICRACDRDRNRKKYQERVA